MEPEAPGRTTTVLGVGNVLLGDEGLGVRAAEALRSRLPPGVRLMDAGSPGPQLLPVIEDASRLLVLDCIDAGREPGTLLRLSPDDLSPDVTAVSAHQFGLRDLLALARLRGREPEEVVILGVQPARIAPGLELSPEVAASLPRLVDEALALLDRVGSWVSEA